MGQGRPGDRTPPTAQTTEKLAKWSTALAEAIGAAYGPEDSATELATVLSKVLTDRAAAGRKQ